MNNPDFCDRGHEFTPENTGRQSSHEGRYCKACKQAQQALWQAANAEKKKWYWKRNRYGLSREAFEREIEKQRGCCGVCGLPFAEEPGLEPVIDHDHVTNKNRGILHRKCNMAIGILQDDPKICRKAAEYLETDHE